MRLKRSLVSVCLLAALAGGTVACGHKGADQKGASKRDTPQLEGVDPGTDEVPATPSPSPPAPSPSPSPPAPIQFPAGQPAIGEKMGEIDIPKIGLAHPIYQGFELKQIDFGPGHWPKSPMPGQVGNVSFAGHRVTHSRPFYDIDKVAIGDKIIFKTPAGEFTYDVTETLIVKPTDVHILDSTPDATVTLLACHPKHSARQRYVVKGKLVSSSPPQPVS